MRQNFNDVLQRSTSVQVEAHWEPIADSTFSLHKESPEHIELFNLSPSYPIKEYGIDAFKTFLPPSSVAVGDVWELDLDGVVPFLLQFHPGATTALKQGEEGAFACLRALSSEYAEITLRIHADFIVGHLADWDWEWKGEKAAEDWMEEARFIPSQFAGQLVINLKERTVRSFSLALPPRNSNVDINAFDCADMVFVPRMELLATDVDDRSEIAWDISITEEEARKALELKFYKFAEIKWRSIEEAVELAKAAHRPIHAILVWGALDDESC